MENTIQESNNRDIAEDIRKYLVSSTNPNWEEITKDYNDVMYVLGFENFYQDTPHHLQNLSEHVLKVMKSVYALDGVDDTSRFRLLLATFFHDAAKPLVKKVNPKTGFLCFYGHDKRSEEVFRAHINVFADISDEDKEYVADLIGLHHVRKLKGSKARKLLNEHPVGFALNLLRLDYADVMGQADFKRAEKLSEIVEFGETLVSVGSEEQVAGVQVFIDKIKKQIALNLK